MTLTPRLGSAPRNWLESDLFVFITALLPRADILSIDSARSLGFLGVTMSCAIISTEYIDSWRSEDGLSLT